MTILEEIDKRMAKVNKIRPFEGEYLKQVYRFFKVETTFSSNAIEGNTHTLTETKVILEDGITVGGRTLNEFYEVEGHGKAYDFMFTLMNKKDILEEELLYCHKLFSQNIPDFISPGEYRNVRIFVTGSRKRFPKAEELPEKLKAFFDWFTKDRKKYHPVMFAAEAHRRYVNIHPFTDGNGRVSRLLMNTCLYQDRYFPVSIPLILKTDYINFLEKNKAKEFGNFIAELELSVIKDLMRMLHIR